MPSAASRKIQALELPRDQENDREAVRKRVAGYRFYRPFA